MDNVLLPYTQDDEKAKFHTYIDEKINQYKGNAAIISQYEKWISENTSRCETEGTDPKMDPVIYNLNKVLGILKFEEAMLTQFFRYFNLQSFLIKEN